MNQIILVGRVVEEPTLIESNEHKLAVITLAVQRNWKNSNGIYETDFIPCILWNAIAENTCEYVHKGDVVGVKGRLQSKEDKIEVIAEKVTFLSRKKASDK